MRHCAEDRRHLSGRQSDGLRYGLWTLFRSMLLAVAYMLILTRICKLVGAVASHLPMARKGDGNAIPVLVFLVILQTLPQSPPGLSSTAAPTQQPPAAHGTAWSGFAGAGQWHPQHPPLLRLHLNGPPLLKPSQPDTAMICLSARTTGLTMYTNSNFEPPVGANSVTCIQSQGCRCSKACTHRLACSSARTLCASACTLHS
jgi:hypothetical protein